ncbi:MAG: hypothetical protein KF749_12595 [Bacteroidetes bacterium]|nr:hypothetical protein [Bacteroidota bacterium]MCW5897107.1 hypothetical protein [Bacteroidota bacterium]
MMKVLGSLEWQRYVRSPRWALAFVLGTGAFILMYLLNVLFAEINPGNWWGITYGTVSSLLMLGAALYAVRRRMLSRSIGDSKAWVQFHLYGGTLAGLLVLLHTGFRLPHGFFDWMLWLLSLWVTLSGLLGVVLQRWIPKILSSGLSVEAMYERIPELVEQVRVRAEKMVESCTEPVRDFYRSNVAAVLIAPQMRLIYYIDVTGGIQSSIKQFGFLRKVLSSEEKEKLDQLQDLYRTKLELDAHYSLQKPLRLWLITHVPLSLVLLLMVAMHIWAVWYY